MVLISLRCVVVGNVRSSFEVEIDDDVTVGKLKDVVKRESEDLKCPSSCLQLFLAKTDNWRWLDEASAAAVKSDDLNHVTPMDSTLYVRDSKYFGSSFQPDKGQVHVLVLVPKIDLKRPAEDEAISNAILKRLKTTALDLSDIKTVLAVIKPKTLTEFKTLPMCEDEFQLDSQSRTQQRDSPIVKTPTLHEFWKGFYEFPPYYFVRMEEVMFWKVVKKLLFSNRPIVFVGSPGVGKSCFLMLLAFYLARIEKRKVLVIRRLRGTDHVNAVVYFDGNGSYARLFDLSPRDIRAIRCQAQGALVLVDGFDQAEVQAPVNELVLAPFHLLATSCQYDVKSDDPSCAVVLPAWRMDDLLAYAKLTNWVIDTGLRKSKELSTFTWLKLVAEQYFYSGGSMREFCRERKWLELRIQNDCPGIDNAQAFELIYSYNGGESKNGVDRLWRHYITDIRQEEQYCHRVFWKLAVDSGYVVRKLARVVDTKKLLQIYRYSESIGADFHGVAYELLLHNAVREAFVTEKPVVLKMREGSKYEKIEIQTEVDCCGEDETSFYSHLSTIEKNIYWYPHYPLFSFIDAVTTCKAFRNGSDEPDEILAYIQVTIRSEKTFNEEKWRKLNEVVDRNSSLKDMDRAFVVVSPDFGVCKKFDLKGAPDADTFLTMVGCFSPEELKQQKEL